LEENCIGFKVLGAGRAIGPKSEPFTGSL